jgi:hypothetical protein
MDDGATRSPRPWQGSLHGHRHQPINDSHGNTNWIQLQGYMLDRRASSGLLSMLEVAAFWQDMGNTKRLLWRSDEAGAALAASLALHSA